jgi:hypothetical protein
MGRWVTFGFGFGPLGLWEHVIIPDLAAGRQDLLGDDWIFLPDFSFRNSKGFDNVSL